MCIGHTHLVRAVRQIHGEQNGLSEIAVIIGSGTAEQLLSFSADEHDRHCVTRLEAAAAQIDRGAGTGLRYIQSMRTSPPCAKAAQGVAAIRSRTRIRARVFIGLHRLSRARCRSVKPIGNGLLVNDYVRVMLRHYHWTVGCSRAIAIHAVHTTLNGRAYLTARLRRDVIGQYLIHQVLSCSTAEEVWIAVSAG